MAVEPSRGRRARVVAVALASLLICSGTGAPAHAVVADNPDPETVRLLTYNVCMNTKCAQAYGLSGTDARLAQIGEWVIGRDGGTKRPDVLALQEAYYKEVSTGPEGNGEKLERAFPGYRIAQKQDQRWILYNIATLTRTDGGGVGVGEPQRDTKVFPWAQFARKGTGHRVTVVNVHLAHGDGPRQRREVDRLAEGITRQLPLGTRTVLAGDFNSTRNDDTAGTHLNQVFERYTGRLTDAVPVDRRTSTLHRTEFTTAYSPVLGPSAGPGRGYRNLPIDHLFHGTGLRCVVGAGEVYKDRGEPAQVTSQAEEDARWAEVHRRRSDHNAVYAELSWSADRC